ncbi:MAG: type II toxin-antitoxin system PemK/MazF family toxin [Burkholderiales bacterium]
MAPFERGAVYLANLNPGRGSEPGKIRPVLVVQNQGLLDAGHPSTIVIPLTTTLTDDAEPLRLRLKARDGLERDSDLLIDQLRAIDNRRLIGETLICCDQDFMEQVFLAVREVMGFS